MALVTLSVAAESKQKIRETEFHRLKQTGLDTRGSNRGGDGRGAKTRLNRRPHRLVGRFDARAVGKNDNAGAQALLPM